MSKNRKYEQKHLAGREAGTKCVRPVRQFAGTGTMYIDLNVTTRIKENSP
jgi:hypothetical protein